MPVLSPTTALWTANNLPEATLNHLHLSKNPDVVINSSFKLGTAAQTTIGLSALSATYFHTLRTGEEQDVHVDARHAVLEFSSESWYTLDGTLPGLGSIWDELAGLYKTIDGYVRIHTNFPHHRKGILHILQCEPTKESVANALSQWNSAEFETEAASRAMCATALRSFNEWDTHPQAQALRGVPPVQIIKVGDAPRRDITGDFERPLDGIRVLDLTRVLAGPVCGRTLAAHGADVLLITSPNLPALPLLDADTSRGKRTAQLDLTLASGRSNLSTLVRDADVFLQAYRPGGLSDKGFGIQDVIKVRPGIVYASLDAYGFEGPWKCRRGFDSLVQTATGFNVAEGESHSSLSDTSLIPRALPVQVLDHAAGYLLVFGINTALSKTITEGGSWEVRVSLASVGHWIRSLGRLSPSVAFGEGKPLPPMVYPQDPEITSIAVTLKQSERAGGGEMTAIRHAATLSKTPVRENDAPVVLNAHEAVWLPRSGILDDT